MAVAKDIFEGLEEAPEPKGVFDGLGEDAVDTAPPSAAEGIGKAARAAAGALVDAPKRAVEGLQDTAAAAAPSAAIIAEDVSGLGTVKKVARDARELPGDVFRGLGRGYATLGKGLGELLRWSGVDEETGKVASDFWARKEAAWAPPEHLQKDLLDAPELLSEPRWWAANAPTVLGTAVPFLLPGVGGAVLGLRLSQAARFGPMATRIAASAGGSGLGAAANAMFEGAMAYGAALEAGAGDEEASHLASKVARRNFIWTAATSAAGLFNPLVKGALARFSFSAAMEGLQESGEDYLSADVLHRGKRGPAPQVSGSSFVLGAVGGAGMSAVVGGEGGGVEQENQTVAAAKQDITTQVVEQLVKAGVPEEVAAAAAPAGVEKVFSEAAQEREGAEGDLRMVGVPAPDIEAEGESEEYVEVPPTPEPPMARGEFVEAAQEAARTEDEDLPAAAAVEAHQEQIEAAEAAGVDVPADVLESAAEPDVDPEEDMDRSPEGEADTTFDFSEEKDAASPRDLWALTPEEFSARLPEAGPEIHKRLVRAMALAGKAVPPSVLAAYPDVAEEAKATIEAKLELQAKRDQKGLSPTPVLDFVRTIGIDPESNLTRELRGELENVLKRGVFRRGGAKLDNIATSAFNEGVIPEATVNALLDAMDGEARLGTKAEQKRGVVVFRDGVEGYGGGGETTGTKTETTEAEKAEDTAPPSTPGTAPSPESSSTPSVSGVSEDFKASGEGQLAFDFGARTVKQYVKAIADEVTAVIRREFPNFKAMLAGVKEFEARGAISYVGKTVRNAADAAEIFSLFRRPDMEHFQVMLVKDGKVVAHPTITSGVIDAALVPPEFMRDVARLMEETGADSYYFAHNHPSGNPTASPEDITLTRKFVKGTDGAPKFKGEFKGHIITDDTEFSLLNEVGDSQRLKFRKPKTDFRPEKAAIDRPSAAVELVSRELADKSRIGVLLLDARLRVLGTEQIPPAAGVGQRITAAMSHFKASAYILAVDAKHQGVLEKETLPYGVKDMVVFDGEEVYSFAGANGGLPLKEGRRKTVNQATRVAEEDGEYRIPVDPADFDSLVKRRKVGPGTKVTVRKAIVDDVAGRIVRGRKGEVLAVDPQTRRLLVDFGEIPLLVDPRDLVETYVPPAPAPRPERPKAAIERTAGPQEPGRQEELLKAKLAGMEKGSAIGARFAARETKARLMEEFRAKMQTESELKQKQLLKAKLEGEQRGSRIGAKFAEKETRTQLEGEARWEAAIRAKVVDFLTESLPVKERGRYLVMVRDARTHKDLITAFLRVDAAAVEIYKKKLIADIRKLVARAADSKSIAVEARRRILASVADIELKGHTDAKIERLQGTADYLRKMEEGGGDVELPRALLRELEILNRRPIASLSEAELERVYQNLKALEEIGRNLQATREFIYEKEKQLIAQELIPGTVPIERSEAVGGRRPGQKLTGWAALRARTSEYIVAATSFFQDAHLAIKPMDVIFDLLDGGKGYTGPNFRLLKGRIDSAFGRYLDARDSWIDPIKKLAAELKLGEVEMERIGIHAIREQKGGAEYLEANGLLPAEINAVKLTPAEDRMYKEMRRVLEVPYPEVRRLLAELYNEDIGKVDNYFPYQTDWDALSEVDVYRRLGDGVGGLGRYAKNVEKGYTKARKGAGKNKIKLHALDIFEKHMDDVAYFIHTQRDIKLLSEVVGSEAYGAAAGDVGQKEMMRWFTLLAKKGGVDAAKKMPRLDKLRRNIGAAVLGFKLSSILIQPTSLFDASALIGGRWVQDGFRSVVVDPELRRWLLATFPELRARIGDDPSFHELAPDRRLAEMQRAGFAALKKIDALAAAASVLGAYRKYLAQRGLKFDMSKPDPRAVAYATLMLRRTQSSGLFKDVATVLSVGALTGNASVDKALFQFQSFQLNRWSVVEHDLYQLGWKGGNKMEAAWGATYLLLANMAEMGIRKGSKALIGGMLAGVGLAVKKEMEDDDDSLLEQFVYQLLGGVPYIGQIASFSTYRPTPVPAINVTAQLFIGGSEALKGKNWKQRMRGVRKAVEALLTTLGVPGTAQIGQISRMLDKKKGFKFPYKKRLKQLLSTNGLTDEERLEVSRLANADRQWTRHNEAFAAQMEREDLEGAAESVRKMTEVVA